MGSDATIEGWDFIDLDWSGRPMSEGIGSA